MHSGGNKDGKGTPVLVRETQSGSGVYHVIGGAGGKLNYLKLKNVKSVEHYRQEAAEGRKAKTEAKKEKIKRDKELGIHESKQKARDDVKSQASAAEREYIKTVAEAMGWEGHQFDPEPTLNLSDAAQKKAFETHHKEWLKKAAEAVDLQRQRLLSDADAREEAFSGEVPLETKDAEVISTQDLDPVRPVTSAGFAADFKGEAEKRGATKEAVKEEKQAMQPEDAPKPRSAEKRQETAKQIAEELKDIRDPVPETAKVKLVEAKQAVELLKAEKKLKAIHAKAREANKQIDKAVEPKGVYNLEAGDADLDVKVKEELENDLKTAAARGFLEEVGKQAGDDPEKSLGRHLGIGANNAFNAVALTSAGAGLIDRMAVDVLGIAGAAQVLARRLQNDLTPDEFADLQDGLQTYHVDHYMAATDDAVKEALEWRDVANGIELEAAGNGHDLTRMRELNQKRMDAVDSATRILGQTLGEMEANAALIMAMKQGKKDKLEVSLGNISLEDAIVRARAIGLARGDYQLNSVGSERFLSLSGAGMDSLAKPITREDQAQIRGNLDIMEGKHDEDGWLPKGIANRPDLATHIQPGISPRLAQQFDASGGVEQGLKDYIGGRTADGDAPADIVADLLSQDMIEKAGDKDAYLAALDKLAPMKSMEIDHDASGQHIRYHVTAAHDAILRDGFKEMSVGGVGVGGGGTSGHTFTYKDREQAENLHKEMRNMEEVRVAGDPMDAAAKILGISKDEVEKRGGYLRGGWDSYYGKKFGRGVTDRDIALNAMSGYVPFHSFAGAEGPKRDFKILPVDVSSGKSVGGEKDGEERWEPASIKAASKEGKLIRAEAHQANFEKYADEFVSSKYGGDVAPLHRQTFETNQKSVDALHRALSEEPAGTLAYQPVGDLDSKGQRALRDWWWANVGKKDERAAGLRQELVEHEKNQPEKESVDMFGETSTNPAWQAWKQERDDKAEALNAAGLDWHKYTQIMGGPAKAHQAVQDMIRGRVAQHFHQAYNTLNPGAPIKLGRTVIAGNLNHLDAVDPAAREKRIDEQRQLVDSLRERIGGKYASGAVSDKISAAREQKEAAEQSQMGFFSTEPEPETETPLAADQRHTLGQAAEQKITAMMSQVGQNFKPGEPTNLWQASMSGKYVNQQRAVKLLEKNKRVVLPQGVGCVDGGTILDDAECRGWSFDQWLQSGERPVVFSKVGEQISLVQASPIFTKGTDEMFLVKTESGREITVTGLHRFLTPDGWQQLRDIGVGGPIFCTASPAPGEYAQDLLPSKAEHVQSIRASSAPSSQQTVEDCPENCCRERRPYGEQPLSEEESGQEFSPLQGDAPEHNRSLRSDGLACEQEHTRPCRYECRHSKTDSLLHAARLGFAWMTRIFSSTTEQIRQKTRDFAQFLSCSCFHRGTCDEQRMHQAQQETSCESRALACQTSVAHAIPLTYQSQIETQPSLCLHCSHPQTQQSPNKGSSAFLPSRIASVVSVGYRLVYDLSVPLSENYIAHGIVNHNSGKTVMMLGGFSHLHETGKAKRGLFVVPSIVQGQFSGEALRYLDPNANGGKGFKWHIEPGASREERIKAYQDPDTHFSVVTHQGFRDDMVHLGAKQAGIDESAMAEKINSMDAGARKEWMRGVMGKAGMSHDFLAVDEGHDLLNRAGKENSLLANVVDSVAHNTPYYVNASADPVKNDPTELFSLLQKVDPARYSDPKAFMRKYGVDTPSAKDELRRELARYFYPGKIESGVKVTRKVEDVKLTADQHKEAKAVESNLARARLARMRGEVDIDAVKALSPSSFEGVDAARHGEIAKKLQTNLGILKESAYRKAINGHENGAKQDTISRLAHERRGTPGVVFAHGLAEVSQIAERLRKEGHRVVVITGSDSSKEKAKKKLMFNPEKGEAQADILVASDAGAVGLNAQRGQWLAQYDTPMTAKTKHQRDGRINRLGQKNDVELIDLVADHPSERRARDRLLKKDELRGILTTPLEGMDDTGLAAHIARARMEREQKGLF